MEQLDMSDERALDLLSVQVWQTVYWAELERRLTPHFARTEARSRALAYVAGLLSPAERKNGWQLAEISGHSNPYGFQHLLGRANWDADTLRDHLRAYVIDYLADDAAIGVIDETGFLKKGRHSAGVARQYSGTAGRVENCQISVFLTYASPHGHTLLDRELYLPKEWTDDPERSQRAGIPEQRAFATKPQLARQMLERAFAAGVRLAWVSGDCVYGDSSQLRSWLEERPQAYLMGVSGKGGVWQEQQQHTISAVLESLPTEGWERLSAGAGSKGPRLYDWRLLELANPERAGWKRWLLVRRSITEAQELRAFLVFAPAQTTLSEMLAVAGTRWTVEESIQTGKGEVGLDHYEVRSWNGWYRHITLAMWAQAFLTVLRKETGGAQALPKGGAVTRGPSSLAAFKAQRGVRFD